MEIPKNEIQQLPRDHDDQHRAHRADQEPAHSGVGFGL
jgi:hypothetical protein